MGRPSITRQSATGGVFEGPREKLERAGLTAMNDEELLAIVLGSGMAKASAVALAGALLAQASGVHGLTRMTRDEIRQTRGIGDAQAARVQAAIELGRRTLARRPQRRPQFINPAETAAYLLPRFGAFPVERFGIALVDTKHRLLRTHIHSVGALDASMAHPRDIFRIAVGAGASGVVLFHNHPSGDPEPSKEDIDLTLRLYAAGKILGVQVVDHVILADTEFFSFRMARVLI
jgi:DNA repair protein RadC